jgi:hypothetical protein
MAASDTHIFTPSRPDGVVCIATRRRPAGLADSEMCGYPAGHPIHAVPFDPPPADAVPTGRALALRGLLLQLTDIAAETGSPKDAAELIERIVREYGGEPR